jgi:hypothetical protein
MAVRDLDGVPWRSGTIGALLAATLIVLTPALAVGAHGGAYHGAAGYHGGYHGGYGYHGGWGHHGSHVVVGGTFFFGPFGYPYPYAYPYASAYPYSYPYPAPYAYPPGYTYPPAYTYAYPAYSPPPSAYAGSTPPPASPDVAESEQVPSTESTGEDARRADYGLVSLHGVPDGAAVDLDGRFWLTADSLQQRWLALPRGAHTLTVRASGARVIERRIEVKAGSTQIVRFARSAG